MIRLPPSSKKKKTPHNLLLVVVSLLWATTTFAETTESFRPDEPLLPYLCALIGTIVYVSLWLIANGRPIWGLSTLLIYWYAKSRATKGTFSREAVSWEDFEKDITCYVLTVPKNEARLNGFRERARKINLSCEPVYGRQANEGDVAPPEVAFTHAEFPAYASHVATNRELFDRVAPETKWILVLEDDAKFLPNFVSDVPSAAKYYENYDVIWLDCRNMLAWTFLNGRVVGGSAGMLYATSALPALARTLDFSDPSYVERRANTPGKTGIQLDAYLADQCNRGRHRCAAAPLVSEQCGSETTVSDY